MFVFQGVLLNLTEVVGTPRGGDRAKLEYLTEAGMIHFHKNNKYGADLDRQLIIAQLHAMDQKLHPAVLLFLCTITTTRSTTSAIQFLYMLYVSKSPQISFSIMQNWMEKRKK